MGGGLSPAVASVFLYSFIFGRVWWIVFFFFDGLNDFFLLVLVWVGYLRVV